MEEEEEDEGAAREAEKQKDTKANTTKNKIDATSFFSTTSWNPS